MIRCCRARTAAALETLGQIKALEDKPDAKLTSNARLEAVLKARIAAGQSSGPAFETAYAETLSAELKPLPWAVVGTRIKEIRSSTQLGSPTLYLKQCSGSRPTRPWPIPCAERNGSGPASCCRSALR